MGQSSLPVCLTCAGSDSGAGAGIQADLKTFAALGCYGTSAITAITAQNTRGVVAVQGVEPEILVKQVDAVWHDIRPKAVKTGMLYSKDIILALADAFQRNRIAQDDPPIVVDPVMVSTSGHTLLSEDAIATLTEKLLPLATVITPNLPEAAMLAGIPIESIDSAQGLVECAKALGKLGPRWIYLKGGHLPLSRSNGCSEKYILDVLYDTAAGRVHKFEKTLVTTANTHGTGCTQSAALCAQLAKGKNMLDALGAAGDYLRGALQASYPVGQGAGPVNHLHNLVPLNLTRPNDFHAHPFTDYLIAKTGDLWEQYVNHPFTVQLGQGTLPMEAFLYFIKQDYSFLRHYARTSALAAYKSKNFEEMRGSIFIVQTVLHEVEMHIKYCETHGITKEELENTKESLLNLAYNRYVLDVANTGDILDLRVATAPCLLGYGEVGMRLVNKPDDEVDRSSKNPYYDWALNYAKEDFQSAVKTGRGILERMVADAPLSQTRLDELAEIFTRTTELEIAFWDSALAAAK